MDKKKLFIILGVVALLGAAGGVFYMQKQSSQGTEADADADVTKVEETMFVIETEHGTIEAELYQEDAPKTVARMVELAKKGFYDGLIFHRVVAGFVVQGGDPDGTGMGGSGQNLNAEFNKRQHVEGTLAMARSSDPNSADSQFYIALDRLPHLDGNYTIWGQVTSGLDVVKKIKQGDKMTKVTVK